MLWNLKLPEVKIWHTNLLLLLKEYIPYMQSNNLNLLLAIVILVERSGFFLSTKVFLSIPKLLTGFLIIKKKTKKSAQDK